MQQPLSSYIVAENLNQDQNFKSCSLHYAIADVPDWYDPICLCSVYLYYSVTFENLEKRYWRNRRCPQHWKKWAWRRYYLEIAKFKFQKCHTSVTFKFPKTHRWCNEAEIISKALKAINYYYTDVAKPQYTWAKHEKNGAIHYHFIFQADYMISKKLIYKTWKKLMNKYTREGYSPKLAYCRDTFSVFAYLKYMFGVNRNHPRETPPWGDLDGRIRHSTIKPR